MLAEVGYGEDASGQDNEEIEEEENSSLTETKSGFSSGERMLKALQEIVDHTNEAIYLFDEWDANLDALNRIRADTLVNQLAKRSRVIEISHRDRDVDQTKMQTVEG